MNRSNKIFFSLVIFATVQCFGMMRQITRDQDGFSVFDGQVHRVKNHDIEPILRNLQVNQLRVFLQEGGKIRAIKLDNGDYVLRAHVPGLAGGPVAAGIAYGITKALCWTGLVGAAVGVVAVTGGAAIGAAGAVATTATATGALAGAVATTAGATAATATAATIGAGAGVLAGGAAVGAAAGATVATSTAVAATAAAVAPEVVALWHWDWGYAGGIELAKLT